MTTLFIFIPGCIYEGDFEYHSVWLGWQAGLTDRLVCRICGSLLIGQMPLENNMYYMYYPRLRTEANRDETWRMDNTFLQQWKNKEVSAGTLSEKIRLGTFYRNPGQKQATSKCQTEWWLSSHFFSSVVNPFCFVFRITASTYLINCSNGNRESTRFWQISLWGPHCESLDLLRNVMWLHDQWCAHHYV